MSKLLVPLAGATEVRDFGGKAAGLARIEALGLSVPKGFALPVGALEAFLEANRLGPAIEKALAGCNGAAEGLCRASAEIREAIFAAPVPSPVLEALESALAKTSASRLIVRSSAVGEDSAAASFAGQLESVPADRQLAALEAALKACWASFWSERVLGYQRARGVRLRGMAVVVQELVEAELSGVVFSAAPLLQAAARAGREATAIEWVRGPGELLVSGQADPGRILIARDSNSSSPLESSAQPEGTEADRVRMEALAPRLRDAALRLEQGLGAPQDIEWCVDAGGSLHFLQARPITARPRLVRWSNVNVAENYPEPVSPLLYSIARRSYFHYFLHLGHAFGVSRYRLRRMEAELAQLVGVHCGRLYYNLTNLYRVVSSLPFGDRVAGFFDDFVGHGAEDGSRHASRFGEVPLPIRLFELVGIGATTLVTILALPRRIRSLEGDVERHVERAEGNRAGGRRATLEELRAEVAGFFEVRFHRWRKAALADAASMFAYGLLTSFLRLRLGMGKGEAHALIKAIPDVVSTLPPQRLWELAQFVRGEPRFAEAFAAGDTARLDGLLDSDEAYAPLRERVADYQAKWGYRCSGELMLSTPNLTEDRRALLEILSGYLATGCASPRETIDEGERSRLLEERRLAQVLSGWLPVALSPSVWRFRLLLRATHGAIAYRERVRMKQAQLYARFRITVRELGARFVEQGWLEAADDVFFLEYPELEALLAGGSMLPGSLRGVVAARKAEHARVSRLSPEDDFPLPFGGTYVPPSVDPAAAGESASERTLRGTGACGGQVIGTARVLGSVLEAGRLREGDILVTRQSDPGWAPLFPMIRGLVMERGGMLSHGAIIAREFGIPAVVGIKGAPGLIRDGQRIRVDGDSGVVELQG